MRVHSILFVAAREAVAMAGGVTARSRHGDLPWPTNGWNAEGRGRGGPMRERWLLVTILALVANGRDMVHRRKNSSPTPSRGFTFCPRSTFSQANRAPRR